MATAAPGQALETLRQEIAQELERLGTDGPTDAELDRVRVQAEAQFMDRLETLGGFGGKADQLNAYYAYTGDANGFERDLQRYLSLTRDHVRDAIATWLVPNQATLLSVVPTGQLSVALADSTPAEVTA